MQQRSKANAPLWGSTFSCAFESPVMASLSFLSGYYFVWLTCYEFASIPPLPGLHPKTACQRVPVSNGPHLRACPFRMTSAQRACIAFTRSKGSPPLLVLPESVSTAAPRVQLPPDDFSLLCHRVQCQPAPCAHTSFLA